MITQKNLQTAYNKHLSSFAPVHSAGAANDAFEVYVFSLILQAAHEENGSIDFEKPSGNNVVSSLIFRTSPGNIFSTAQDYCYANIKFPDNLNFEAHIGVYVEGVAGVIHECDVLVIDAAEGQFCRRHSVHPKRTSILLSAECKFYTGNLGIQLGRQFLGITTDLGRENRFLISNSDGRSTDRVLAHHKRQRYLGLTPLSSDTETQVVALFRNTFRNKRAKVR
jgi:hypothetical protein